MNKTVLIGHSWDGRDDKQWLFWLEKKLEEMGFEVSMRELPELSSDIEQWLPVLEDTYQIPENNVHIVRHDPGCLTILSYLNRLSRQSVSEPTLLIAGQPKRSKAASVFDYLEQDFRQKKLPDSFASKSQISNSTPNLSVYHLKNNDQKNNLDVALVVIFGGIIPEKIANRETLKLSRANDKPRTNPKNTLLSYLKSLLGVK